MPRPDDRVRLAARNNAELCDLVARAAGVTGSFGPDVWSADHRTPPRHPDAVTLVPGAAARTVLAGIDDSPGASVKDSFCDLDLAPHGYRVLFSAEWIHRPAPPGSAGVPATAPELVTLAGAGIGSALANASRTVVGLSNVEVAGVAGWEWVVRAAWIRFPGLDAVGYERGETLDAARAAGFAAIGPLRVWVRD